MKGLLIKDLGLMRGQKRFFFVMAVLSVFMAISLNNSFMLMSYMTFILSMFTLNTISYDEFDRGYLFLFTLPISRKSYVAEKYLLTALLGITSIVTATVLSVIISLATAKDINILELLAAGPLILCAVFIIQSVMIPLHFKFGADKSRIALIIISVVIGLGVIGVLELLEFMGIGTKLISSTAEISMTVIILGIVALGVLSVLISMKISIAIMNKKEF